MDKLNYKLSKFFDSKKNKTIRTASLGYLENVSSPEDMKLLAPMFNEMIQLPKYQPTIDKLRSASGFINFATKDGYSQLIECVLKAAFPLNNNDIFNMVDHEITGGSFAIGAGYFGTKPEPSLEKAFVKASNTMESLIFGSDALMSREYLKDKGWTDDQITNTFGSYKDSVIEEWIREDAKARQDGNPAGASPPPSVRQNTAPGSQVGWEMAKYEYFIKQVTKRWNAFINDIDSQIKGQEQEDGTWLKPSPEQEKSLKENRQYLVKMKRDEIDVIRADFTPVLGPPTKDRMTGNLAKNKDGFLNYNPAKEIIDNSRDLIRLLMTYNPAAPRKTDSKEKSRGELIQSNIMRLRKLIPEYKTTDPGYKRVSDEFLKMLGDGNPEDLVRVKSNLTGTVARLQKMLVDRVVQHGKVLILDDIDKTVLCQQAQKGEVTMIKSFKHLISDFIARNNSNIEKDTSVQTVLINEKDKDGKDIVREKQIPPKKENGNRIIVAISSEPISAMPAGTETVELDTSPVNPEEADIIVKYLVSILDREKKIWLKYKKNEEVEARNADKSPDVLRKELDRVSLTPKDQESLVDEISKKKLSSYISGLNVRDAIASIRSALKQAERKDETDPLRPNVTLDTKYLLTSLKDQVNKRIQSEVLGVKLGRVEVKFDDYAYSKNSQWSKRVVGISEVKMQLDANKALMESDTARIVKIDEVLERGSDANGKLSEQDRNIYISERQYLVSRIASTEQERSSLAAKNIPHIYVLWGKPGVGKSIWAQALADLLDLGIVEVDITAQFDKWVGESGKNARKLLNMMSNAKDTVFLIDEIDRQIQQGGDKNKSQQSSHETTKQVVYQFLQFFEDSNNNKLFESNAVFFVMTSNNEDCIDKALLQRTTFAEVELPENPEDYEKFFKSYMKVERERDAEHPWFRNAEAEAGMARELANMDEKTRAKKIQQMGWDYTFEVINNKLDWKRIAVEFARKREDTGSGIDFRTLKKVLQDAYTFDGIWQNSMRRVNTTVDASTAIKNIHGLPLSTENILQAAKFIDTSERENKRFNLGVTKVVSKKEQKLKEFVDKYAGQKLQVETYMDEFAKKFLETPGLSEQRKKEFMAREQKQKGLIPQDVIDFMERGEVSIEDDPEIPLPEYMGGEEIIDPETGLAKTVKGIQPKTPQQEVQELMEESFEEGEGEVPVEDQTVTPPVEEQAHKPNQKQKGKQPQVPQRYAPFHIPEAGEEKISSSTDYYYQFLQKKGILDEEGKVQIEKIRQAKKEAKKEARMAKLAARNIVQKPNAKMGELFYNGFVLISQGPQ